MLDHLSLGVSELPRAVAFYDAVLSPLGYARVWITERHAGYGPPGGNDKLALAEVAGAAQAPGAGCHVAFTARTREAVDRFHAAALRCGGTDDGPPGPRPQYGPGYYAAFVRDPDGYRLEAVCHE